MVRAGARSADSSRATAYLGHAQRELAVLDIQRHLDNLDIVDLSRDAVHAVRRRCNQDLLLAWRTGDAHDEVDDLVRAHAEKDKARIGHRAQGADEVLDREVGWRRVAVQVGQDVGVQGLERGIRGLEKGI